MVEKSLKTCFVYPITFIALVSFILSPCNCFASENSSLDHSSLHACCEDDSRQTDKNKDCGACGDCLQSADYLVKGDATLRVLLGIDQLPPLLKHSYSVSLGEEANKTTLAIGPPDFSTPLRLSLLQRWLI